MGARPGRSPIFFVVISAAAIDLDGYGRGAPVKRGEGGYGRAQESHRRAVRQRASVFMCEQISVFSYRRIAGHFQCDTEGQWTLAYT